MCYTLACSFNLETCSAVKYELKIELFVFFARKFWIIHLVIQNWIQYLSSVVTHFLQIWCNSSITMLLKLIIWISAILYLELSWHMAHFMAHLSKAIRIASLTQPKSITVSEQINSLITQWLFLHKFLRHCPNFRCRFAPHWIEMLNKI